MTKKITTAIMAMGLIGSALAQDKDYKNAPFVGVSIGSGKVDRTLHYGDGTSISDSSSGGAYFGILGGYHHVVSPELAIRGYGELEYHPITVEYDDVGDKKSSYLNIIVGADALYYLKQDDAFDMAAFAGLGVALSRYSQEMLLNTEKRALGFAFRAGMHFDIASDGKKRHGIDVGLKILPNKVTTSTPETRYYYGTTLKVEQKPSVFARYTFSF